MNKVKKTAFTLISFVIFAGLVSSESYASYNNRQRYAGRSYKVNRQYVQTQNRHRDKLERKRTKEYEIYRQLKPLQIQPVFAIKTPYDLWLTSLYVASQMRLNWQSQESQSKASNVPRPMKLYDDQRNEPVGNVTPAHHRVPHSCTDYEDAVYRK